MHINKNGVLSSSQIGTSLYQDGVLPSIPSAFNPHITTQSGLGQKAIELTWPEFSMV